MKTVEMKTADLIGPALDWAVARAQGWTFGPPHKGHGLDVWRDESGKWVGTLPAQAFKPSTDWGQGGPLIEKYKLTIQQVNGIAATFADDTGEPDYDGRTMRIADGVTVLIAACRAIVSAKLGDTVSVPAELVGGDV